MAVHTSIKLKLTENSGISIPNAISLQFRELGATIYIGVGERGV